MIFDRSHYKQLKNIVQKIIDNSEFKWKKKKLNTNTKNITTTTMGHLDLKVLLNIALIIIILLLLLLQIQLLTLKPRCRFMQYFRHFKRVHVKLNVYDVICTPELATEFILDNKFKSKDALSLPTAPVVEKLSIEVGEICR